MPPAWWWILPCLHGEVLGVPGPAPLMAVPSLSPQRGAVCCAAECCHHVHQTAGESWIQCGRSSPCQLEQSEGWPAAALQGQLPVGGLGEVGTGMALILLFLHTGDV